MTVRTLFALAAAVCIIGGFFFYSVFFSLSEPQEVEPFTISVRQGATLSGVARELQKKEVISNAKKFVLLAKLLGKENQLRFGEYEFKSQGNHPLHILKKLTSGEVKKHKLTIPEGYNVVQIAELLEHSDLVTAEDFETYALSEEAAREQRVPGPTLEGYLFPTTYFFTRFSTPQTIAHEMVAQYKSVMTDKLRKRMKQLDFDEKQVVTLASIVEKETSEEEERGRISAVFHNRLKRNMRLQADPTVIYGIDNFDGNITKRDLQTFTPYNTYRIKGLPPGPIASPGKAAIEAALYPEQSDFLYFVANREGKHDFSRTYKEHHEKVLEFQVRRRRKK